MRIGFIFPSSDYLHDPFRGDPHTHLQILTAIDARLGDRVELNLIDLRGIGREWAIHHIPACDIYLQSVYTLDVEEQTAIVQSIRKHYPEAVHIAGGPHVAEFETESLRTFDALVLGEGEEVIIQAINDVEAGCLKKTYRQEAPIDVNAYPFPSRRFLPKSTTARKDMLTLKHKKGYDQLWGTTTIFSRGCPYQCAFCAMPKTRASQTIRYRRPDLISEEIAYLQREYGIEGINLLDEIGIPLRRDHAVAHLEAIEKTGIVWRGQCRVDGITPEIAALARRSGCVALGMGVESAWQPSLDAINKKIQVERAKDAIRLLKENDIEVRIYMILGLPGEPQDIVDRTWNFVQETEPDLVIASLFTVRPGTAVYNEPERFGIVDITTDWSKTRHMHGRYEKETPSLTFQYAETTPWGKSLTQERIVENYMDLQQRLRSQGLSTL